VTIILTRDVKGTEFCGRAKLFFCGMVRDWDVLHSGTGKIWDKTGQVGTKPDPRDFYFILLKIRTRNRNLKLQLIETRTRKSKVEIENRNRN